ncbi:MAG: AAA family ATPase [Deltaproteobacteria bacterium]|nr:AAA family ATPase [Deltaproteobacteria bacterium]
MDYLEYFGLTAEPFSHAPVSRFYYASKQHTDALKRLMFATQTMKGLAILIGDIGHGKTTLARRLLDALPSSQFEAAMLVIVHAGVTATWLLKHIAKQLGVIEPPDDKLTILSQLYLRLVEIHNNGKHAIVIIDEAQMLATRELMEEFRGLLNLEVTEQKLISFVFFGLPEVERNLRLDPPLAQRVALRYHLRPLSVEETVAYVQHRLKLAGAKDELLPKDAVTAIHKHTKGIPRLINTLCDNVLLELFFQKLAVASVEIVDSSAENLQLTLNADDSSSQSVLGITGAIDNPTPPATTNEEAVIYVSRTENLAPATLSVDPDAIAARVAKEKGTTLDIDDPLAFLHHHEETAAEDDNEISSISSNETETLEEEPGQTIAEPMTVQLENHTSLMPPATAANTGYRGDNIVFINENEFVDLSHIKPKLIVPAPSLSGEIINEKITSRNNSNAAKSILTNAVRTSTGTIDLNEIDEILADIKRR